MSYYFDSKIIDDIRNAPGNSIEDVVGEHLKLDRKGRNFIGLCPFHDDHKPSLTVTPEIGRFKCFACGAGGDIFSFIQMREGLSFPETVKRLADRAGITLREKKAPAEEKEVFESPSGLVYKANKWALNYWRGVLERSEMGAKAREYLKERQIGEEASKAWAVGCAPEGWRNLTDAAISAGISERLLIEAGLCKKREESGRLYDAFRDRLMFPIFDASGNVIGFGGRTLGDENAKYINSPVTPVFDKSRSIYGIDKARHGIVREGRSVLVEGYTDVLMAHQFGIDNVAAALGTSFTEGHAKLLRRYARRLVIMLDGDKAGINAAERALEVCLRESMDVQICIIEGGMDPCEFLLSEGRDKFVELINTAEDGIKWKWQKLKADFEASGISDGKFLVEKFVKFLSEAVENGSVDDITKGLIVNRLCSLSGVSREQVNKMIYKNISSKRIFHDKNRSVDVINTGGDYISVAEREVLEVLLCSPGCAGKIRNRICPNDFTVPVLKKLAEKIFPLTESGDSIETALVFNGLDEKEIRLVNEMIDSGNEKQNFEKRIQDAAEVIYFDKSDSEQEDSESLDKYLENIRSKQENSRYKNLRNGLF
ncbi:DNA primase [Sedimentisphaera cyanobacteriorum]|uniref:DNA primase n=1 Tax=Sedimentisphaera cyanobacteriorum TaxID=1940790 RepID=A0A1Q2HS12_9BACT|nr:DNA primase [Sedimentisphaera cyanobacteriorum]AQQ10121.1 DNA primase [Sedimentisphaera cyanobacteriorum]